MILILYPRFEAPLCHANKNIFENSKKKRYRKGFFAFPNLRSFFLERKHFFSVFAFRENFSPFFCKFHSVTKNFHRMYEDCIKMGFSDPSTQYFQIFDEISEKNYCLFRFCRFSIFILCFVAPLCLNNYSKGGFYHFGHWFHFSIIEREFQCISTWKLVKSSRRSFFCSVMSKLRCRVWCFRIRLS